jgi:DSF synthase
MSGMPLAARFDDRHLIGHARPAKPSLSPPAPVPAHLQVAAERYDELEVSLDPQTRTYWCSMAPKGAPSFTPGLLRDLAAMQRSIRQLCTQGGNEADAPVRHYVLKSSLPGIFNLGGDLGLFANRIRARDRDSLRTYAYACVDVLYNNFVAFDRSVITVALALRSTSASVRRGRTRGASSRW